MVLGLRKRTAVAIGLHRFQCAAFDHCTCYASRDASSTNRELG